ncbi:MAG: TIGR01777 family oxidoreductase [Hydrogenibacillus schlegelii]|uniref:TIGR01777 family oxidoreductase n=1 Tax=Hydrogenibacillus schlegelii TaxID=1484 RepID=A0A947CYM2_HYDSH|nr:TIGR01777 family oxidoreductase [Hydrogenibacillus schlegelii]
MRIVIAGGSGLIGRNLTRSLLEDGHTVLWLTRNPRLSDRAVIAAPPPAERTTRSFSGSGASRPGPIPVSWLAADARPEDELERHAPLDAAVNLAGTPIDGRWTPAKKRHILESRLRATAVLLELLARLPAEARPRVLISASAVEARLPVPPEAETDPTEAVLRERGLSFLAAVTRRWETAAGRAEALGLRTVFARFGVVFAGEGGAFPRLVLPYRLFAGGPIAGGRAWVSWVHIADVVGLIRLALEDATVVGPLHVTAPNPATMDAIGRAVAARLRRPHWLPVPAFALRLALGEMSDLLIRGHRVLPEEALARGYAFRFPTVETALQDLLSPPKAGSGPPA